MSEINFEEGNGHPPVVTVRTVAARAGVSITTVSRVLNGKVDAISEATQRRVRAAAQELDYRPNSLAVSLRRGSTRTVGLIVPDITDSYFHVIARGVEDVAQEHGYSMILCNTDRRADKERKYVELLREKQVDAMIFAGFGVDEDQHLQDVFPRGARVVTIGARCLPYPRLEVDNRLAFAAAVSHLVEQGCRRVACIGGRPNWVAHQTSLEGYLDGLAQAGLEPDPALVWEGDFGFESGSEAVARALAAGVEFDGILGFNDIAAVGALKQLQQAGLRVPDDVAVVGCDDILLARMAQPALTTIQYPTYEFGATAMRLVLRLAAGLEVPAVTSLGYRLVIRESSDRSAVRRRRPAGRVRASAS